ncbi:hypothetical protein AVEN_202856-1 [Araneus ventricosus]|uniref:Uncharacterized protein n=1 Tax=Araneus ventricosus TaxID=182803 RepID=A0A4Y2GKY2_ARAVE|nr:hypothetical protein AVEN_202856-1 [Araneus ventricosus]
MARSENQASANHNSYKDLWLELPISGDLNWSKQDTSRHLLPFLQLRISYLVGKEFFGFEPDVFLKSAMLTRNFARRRGTETNLQSEGTISKVPFLKTRIRTKK